MSKFSRAPRQRNNSLDDFIEGAGMRQEDVINGQTTQQDPLPWEDPLVRTDVLKTYNLRLPEPYLLKLKFIASNTPVSMQAFCMAELLPAIDRQVSEILASKGP